jgi:2-amino-4-hydroxy-6-hydroxymethyldihydropteridine diphosphokinase
LSLGSNIGDRQHHLTTALQELGALGVSVEEASPFYETEPVDFKDQPWFLNQVVRVFTDLAPTELLEACLRTEDRHGRRRDVDKGPRTLDLDILLYDDLVFQDSQLEIPHPRMASRRFVLEPLAVLAADRRHPVLGATFGTLLARCQDASRVRRLEETV